MPVVFARIGITSGPEVGPATLTDVHQALAEVPVDHARQGEKTLVTSEVFDVPLGPIARATFVTIRADRPMVAVLTPVAGGPGQRVPFDEALNLVTTGAPLSAIRIEGPGKFRYVVAGSR